MTWTDRDLQAFKPKATPYRVTEHIRERNRGRLVLKIWPDGGKDFFFQYHFDGARTLIQIGRYKGRGEFGISLADARDRAREWGKLVSQGVNVKQHLGLQKLPAEATAPATGTFWDLIESYLASMEVAGKTSHDHVRRSLNTYIIGPFSRLIKRPANAITKDDVIVILKRMIDAGVTTHTNRVRSYLHAAFQHGIEQENNPRRFTKGNVRFNLQINPVSVVPRQKDFERVGEHVIRVDEIKTIWEGILAQGRVAGYVIRLAIATGQRPGELARLRWSDCDLNTNEITIPAHVSKNRIEHLVPVNGLGMESIVALRELSGEQEHMFPASRGGKFQPGHIVSTSIDKAVRVFCETADVQKFTPRDVRRTVKSKLAELGISKEIRDRVQNHAINADVAERHYNRHDFKAEKREALRVWGEHLELIIRPRKNVTRMNRRAS